MIDTAKKHTILIVEDEPSLLHALTDKITREGFFALQARDGMEGLTTALQKHPDLILLDIVMPQMDGLTMMRKLRAENTWGKDVPIILLTNLSASDDKIITSVSQDEPAYYLEKNSLSLDEVIVKIHEALNRP